MSQKELNYLQLASNVYSKFACFPTLNNARLNTAVFNLKNRHRHSNVLLQTTWSQTDALRRDRVTLTEDYLLDISKPIPSLLYVCPQSMKSAGVCFPYSDFCCKQLWNVHWFSKSSNRNQYRTAIFFEYKLPVNAMVDNQLMRETAAVPGTFVHIYSEGNRIKSIKLPTEKKDKNGPVHLHVYGKKETLSPFSSCKFSNDGKKLIYLAESVNSGSSRDTETLFDKNMGNQSTFVYRSNWGEGLASVTQPVICTLNIETEKVECLHSALMKIDRRSKTWSFDSPSWTPGDDGIIFVAYDNEPYPLGMLHCCQRPSQVFYWNIANASLVLISAENRASKWPQFSPDGSKLIWFEMPQGGPHNQCHELHCCAWPISSAPEICVPLVNSPQDSNDFPGLFLSDGIPDRCWTSDCNAILFSSIWTSDLALLLIDLRKGINQIDRLVKLPSPICDFDKSYFCETPYGVVHLLDVYENIVVVQTSSPTIPSFVAVCKLPDRFLDTKDIIGDIKWLILGLGGGPPPIMLGVNWKILKHKAQIPDDRFNVNSFESIVVFSTDAATYQLSIGPTFKAVGHDWTSPVGLIVIPHGGPHSSFLSEWNSLLMAYVGMGYACLLVNYRGSTGYGNFSIHSLPGKIGFNDVSDCLQAAVDAGNCLPDVPIVLMGGSHGGFIALHLAGQYRSMFRSVIARNPVTNLVSMLGTSDIPDWCWEECGLGANKEETVEHPEETCRSWTYSSRPIAESDLICLGNASPISYITPEWSVPMLLCLGSNDLRVPNSQGINFFNILKANLQERSADLCQMLQFPTEAHPIESPAASEENFVRGVCWFGKSLGLFNE